ncbi:MAG: uroporphyrinogen decarboxylase family protein [Ignavibacteria bacterium]|jgi:uroporphyrinogen decarboxylase
MIKTAETASKLLVKEVIKAYDERRRIVAPLVGFPGLNMSGSTIKLAQQNYDEHFKTLKAIAETFEPDAIFPLMDLSVEANALGRYTLFPKEDSATVVKDEFNHNNIKEIERINIQFDTRLLGYVETLKFMKIGLPQSIMRGAYVTGPYTLTGLMMGADEAAIATVMTPDDLHDLCALTTNKIQEYVRLLVAAGAQMICILEPSAVMLGPDQFEEFSGQYVKRIVDSYLHTNVAMIYHICGNTMHLLEKMCESGVNALSLDSAETGVDLPAAAKRVSEDIIIIGNISTVGTLLNGKPPEVEDEVTRLLKDMNEFPNFVLSSGCDLPQETPVENIQAFMKACRNYKIT